MVTPHIARDRVITPEPSERDALLNRLARLVADCDDHSLLARLVIDLEASANASLGAATSDPTVVLVRRFDRAHRHIVTGASTATAAGVQHWIAEFDGVAARKIEARPRGHASAAPRGAVRDGDTLVRAAPHRRNLLRRVRIRADGTCAQA